MYAAEGGSTGGEQGPLQNGTARRPPKKPRCERKRGPRQKAGSQVGPADEAPLGASALDLEVRLQSGEKGPSEDPHDVADENREPKRTEEGEGEDQDEGEETDMGGASTSVQMEPEEVSSQIGELDNSIFLNEDSNQPLPMDRFFGNVAFTQDLPPAAFSRTNTSRREFRRMHFIAKEEEEESGEEVA